MKGQVGHTAWTLQAQRVNGRIALLPLLRRELHVPYAVADDVRSGMQRVTSEIPPPVPRDGGWILRFDQIVSDSVSGGKLGDWVVDGQGSAG